MTVALYTFVPPNFKLKPTLFGVVDDDSRPSQVTRTTRLAVRNPAGSVYVVVKSVSPLIQFTVSELPKAADNVTGLVPEAAFSVVVPAAVALGCRVVVPLVDPPKPSVPDVEPGIPSTGAVVNAGAAVELVLFPNTVPPPAVATPVPPFPTGSEPETSVVRETALHDGVVPL